MRQVYKLVSTLCMGYLSFETVRPPAEPPVERLAECRKVSMEYSPPPGKCPATQHHAISLGTGKGPMLSLQSDGSCILQQSKSGLERIPYEIMGLIIRDLDLEDIFGLSLSSKHFQYLVREERICRVILTVSSYMRFTTYILQMCRTDTNHRRKPPTPWRRERPRKPASPARCGD